MLLTCSCGQTNRLPSQPKSKMKCGKCKHEFTPTELAKGRPEPPPARTLGDFIDDEPTHACRDEEDCGWEGVEDDLEDGKYCPDCTRPVRKLKVRKERQEEQEREEE